MEYARIAAAVIAVVITLVIPSSAGAVFPGRNGELFFTYADGNHYLINSYSVRALNPRTGRVRTLFTCGPVGSASAGCDLGVPAIAPNGSELAVLGDIPSYFTGSVAWRFLLRMDLRGGQRRLVPMAGEPAPPYQGGVQWAPDGRSLVYPKEVRPPSFYPAHTELFHLGLDGRDGDSLTPGSDLGNADLSSSGRIVVSCGRLSGASCGQGLYAQRGDRSFHRVTRGGNDFDPAWSPHGKKIAFSRAVGPNIDSGNLYLVGSNGRGLHRLTWHGGHRPRWSPDGRYLALVRDGHLYTLDLRHKRLRRYFPVEFDYTAVFDFDWARR